jgi:5-aminolevulinate synthase
MFSYNSFFEGYLTNLKQEGNHRTFVSNARTGGQLPVTFVDTPQGKEQVTVWCSNDYLGMSQHPDVIEAGRAALAKYGCGSGGTRNISGTHPEIVGLEQDIAQWVGKEASLVFSSGYVANQTALESLLKNIPDCTVLSDELNHDSIIQGIRLSRANKVVFRHNDIAHLKHLLLQLPLEAPKVIAFESVYSMEGDFGPIREIAKLAKQFNALTFLDETHGVGLYGLQGGGVCQSLGLSDQIDFIQGGLGKGVGVVGGFIAGSASAVDFIRSTGRGFIFTTSLPPATCAAARASINYIRGSSKERAAVHFLAKSLRQELDRMGIRYIGEGAHIVPVIIGETKRCSRICKKLLVDHKLYLQPINAPTVPKGTERMRITPTALHAHSDITVLVAAIAEELMAELSVMAESAEGPLLEKNMVKNKTSSPAQRS